jgi:uncharacterized membrane protein YhiD involved in acid resistance
MKTVFIIVVTFIISTLLVVYSYEKKDKNRVNYIKEYENLQYKFDSIQKEIDRKDSLLIKQRVVSDSLLTLKEKEKAKQIEIKRKYETILNNLNSLPVNDRIEFFSGWLSETDSITK